RAEGLHPDDHPGEGRAPRARPATAESPVRGRPGEPHFVDRHSPDDPVFRRLVELVRLFGQAYPVRGIDRIRGRVLLRPPPRDPRLSRDGALPRREALPRAVVPPVLPPVDSASRGARGLHRYAGSAPEPAGPPGQRGGGTSRWPP